MFSIIYVFQLGVSNNSNNNKNGKRLILGGICEVLIGCLFAFCEE